MSADHESRDPESTRAGPRGDPSAARRVGPYRIQGELGRGGMGVVYRAFDERLHREVALKALPEELVGDAEQLARLEREARSLAAISHANVAMIFGMEESDSSCYLVLELVEGETLHDRLARGALGLEEAVELCGQVAAGLEAVHRKGLVHRDLKPSNVMVTPEGAAKLLDFGLAKRSLAQATGEVTRRDVVAGTPGWMSPEQLRGDELDARSDAWAWGCLLFECLAGTPAFPGESWAERDAATLKSEPDWERLPEELGSELRALLDDCLSKDRAGRPASLDEVRHRLSGSGTPSGRGASLHCHSLPAERDEFVGREADLRELGERLDDGARLVSVLGIGGSGKTRLVLHLVGQRLADWPGGAWFCDLSEARSVEGIVHAVAATLDVPLGKDDPVVQLGHAIAGRGRCLVILDNFEQVARHADQTLGRWLDRCDEASFVVTTREVLGLPGEQSLPLAPLEQLDAEALFVARARAARPDFVPEGKERAEIPRLAALLDHLPLAIELAAARVRLMSVAQVLSRMSERFKLLTGSGARRDRQATLRATLDWSWDLLAEWEQAALAQLSVFEGGLTLEAAEAVLDLSAWSEAPWAVDAVQALVDKSLLRRVGDDRLEPLVTVQEYAAERLRERGGVESTARRHGRFFASLGLPKALRAVRRAGGARVRRALSLDLENVVAACRRAVQRSDAEVAVPTLAAASCVLELSGPHATGRALAEEVLALASLDEMARLRTLGILGRALALSGRPEDARSRHAEALVLARSLGEGLAEAEQLRRMALLDDRCGRVEQAREGLEAALRLARHVGDRFVEASILLDVGNAQVVVGDLDDARATLESTLEIARSESDRRLEGKALCCLANLVRKTSASEARSMYELALEALREQGDRSTEALVLSNLANLNRSHGRAAEATVQLQAVRAIGRELGSRTLESAANAGLGLMFQREGRLEEARRYLERALEMALELGNRRGEGIHCGNLGTLNAREGRVEEARSCLEKALSIHREVGFRHGQAHWLSGLSRLARERGDVLGATSLAEQAVEIARGEASLLTSCYATLAWARLAASDRSGARHALDAAEGCHPENEPRIELLCARIALSKAEEDLAAVRAGLAEAEALARRLELPPRSELALLIAEFRRELGAKHVP